MKNTALIFLFLFLTGCAGKPVDLSGGAIFSPDDFYRKRTPEFNFDQIKIKWVRAKREGFLSLSKSLFGTAEKNGYPLINGLSIPPQAEGGRCVVFTEDLEDTNALTKILGHEILHCFQGFWHGIPGDENSSPHNEKFQNVVNRLEILAVVSVFFKKHFDDVAVFLELDSETIKNAIKFGEENVQF